MHYRRCNTCGEYIYKGKKFNARKETVEGEDYYGIKIFRCASVWQPSLHSTHILCIAFTSFYIKWCVCSHPVCDLNSANFRAPSTLCSAEITFKTDPKNTDYTAEHGASRNFEPWREVEIVEEEDRLAKLEEEENNPMKVLENRTTDSKREMEILDALQDIRARNARHERVAAGPAAEAALEARLEVVVDEAELKRKQEEEEDDAIVRQYFSKIPDASTPASSSKSNVPASLPANPTHDYGDVITESADPAALPPESSQHMITVKRKADFLEPGLDAMMSQAAQAAMPKISQPSKKKKADLAGKLGVRVKPKVKA